MNLAISFTADHLPPFWQVSSLTRLLGKKQYRGGGNRVLLMVGNIRVKTEALAEQHSKYFHELVVSTSTRERKGQFLSISFAGTIAAFRTFVGGPAFPQSRSGKQVLS